MWVYISGKLSSVPNFALGQKIVTGGISYHFGAPRGDTVMYSQTCRNKWIITSHIVSKKNFRRHNYINGWIWLFPLSPSPSRRSSGILKVRKHRAVNARNKMNFTIAMWIIHQFASVIVKLEDSGFNLAPESTNHPWRPLSLPNTVGKMINVLHPRKLTWNPKMEVWKMIFLFNWVIFRFHVNFQGRIKAHRWIFCSPLVLH